jgi:hypothetical protein
MLFPTQAKRRVVEAVVLRRFDPCSHLFGHHYVLFLMFPQIPKLQD